MTAVLTSFGELPAVQLSAPDGAQATITLYGAHLVSWKSADGRERLFCSTGCALDGSGPIRGGVPVIFPQFAARGTGMRHGFARVSGWRLAASGAGDGETFA
ncbi:MAG: D-hexose-6-phosphate mutarotase, partial [Telluria sp.]